MFSDWQDVMQEWHWTRPGRTELGIKLYRTNWYLCKQYRFWSPAYTITPPPQQSPIPKYHEADFRSYTCTQNTCIRYLHNIVTTENDTLQSMSFLRRTSTTTVAVVISRGCSLQVEFWKIISGIGEEDGFWENSISIQNMFRTIEQHFIIFFTFKH